MKKGFVYGPFKTKELWDRAVDEAYLILPGSVIEIERFKRFWFEYKKLSCIDLSENRPLFCEKEYFNMELIEVLPYLNFNDYGNCFDFEQTGE